MQHFIFRMSLDDIFAALEASRNSKVQAEASETDHVIQKHLILDQIPQLVEILAQWSEDGAVSPCSLRFFTHLVLFFDHLGEAIDRALAEKVIER